MTSTPRPTRSTRLAALIAAVVLLAACGGGDDDTADESADEPAEEPADDPADEPADEVDDVAADTADEVDDDVAEEPTDESADGVTESTEPAGEIGDSGDFDPGAEHVRVVNLTADPVDVYVRSTGLVEAFDVEAGLAPGEITAYVAPPQDGSVVVTTAGAGDPTCVSGCDHFIANISAWDDTGDTFTVLLHDADGEPEAFDLWEETGANTESANAMVAADPSTGQYVAIGADVADNDFGMRMGQVGIGGCLEPVNLNGGILVGGNQTPAYVYDGDSVEVVLYDNQDQDCTGDPVGGPFTLSGGPGTRTFLFLSGTPGDLEVLVVPFGSDLGVSADDQSSGEPDDEQVAAGDDAVTLFAEQMVIELGLPIDDAMCMSEVVVDAVPDLIVFEDGQLVEPPDTPENNERAIAALTDAAAECGVDTDG